MQRSNNVVVDMFLSIFNLFERVYTEFGAWSYLLGAFILYTIYRLLLVPILGGGVGKSDTVKKIRKEDK